MINARNAYGIGNAQMKTDSQVEYEAFVRITRNLENAQQNMKGDFARFAEALYQNRKLWSILAVDVASPDNKLPADLRARIFYLAEFTEAHTRKVLNREDSADVLLDINKSIMRGLNPSSSIS